MNTYTNTHIYTRTYICVYGRHKAPKVTWISRYTVTKGTRNCLSSHIIILLAQCQLLKSLASYWAQLVVDASKHIYANIKTHRTHINFRKIPFRTSINHEKHNIRHFGKALHKRLWKYIHSYMHTHIHAYIHNIETISDINLLTILGRKLKFTSM